MKDPVPPLKRYVWTWIALLVLLALTTASSFVHLDGLNLTANLGIAAAKAVLVALVFMHLRHGAPMVRIAAVAGLFWLGLLASLSLVDFVSRGL
jgi:cytochrome c oxidase subunit 4